jgi:hypothetical protein
MTQHSPLKAGGPKEADIQVWLLHNKRPSKRPAPSRHGHFGSSTIARN